MKVVSPIESDYTKVYSIEYNGNRLRSKTVGRNLFLAILVALEVALDVALEFALEVALEV